MNTYIEHIGELRTRVIRYSMFMLLLFTGFFLINGDLYQWIAKPALEQLPNGSLIATEVTTPFTVPMRLAFVCAFSLSIPYLFYELWSFITPGLYANEKKKILPFLIFSTCLFYLGILFAYFILCPTALAFFHRCAPPGVAIMTDIRSYLDFVLTMLLAGGIAFQVPILTIAVVRFKLCSHEKLIHFRPYIIVGAFILGMLLTPPDVVSQVLLALPMWGLFEIGLLLAKS